MLNLSSDIRPISYVKAHAAEMVRQVDEGRTPLVITQNGEAKAVLLDVNTYQSLLDAVNLMKLVSIGENDFKRGRTATHDEVRARMDALLG